MNEIEVQIVSGEEASFGVAELWRDGEQIAYTHYDPEGGSDLQLQIDPRADGSPLVVEVGSLREALAEVERVLATY